MSEQGSREQITRGEIGVGQKVDVFDGSTRYRGGVVDALWIPAAPLRLFPNEVRVRVKLADGSLWTGPHTAVEPA